MFPVHTRYSLLSHRETDILPPWYNQVPFPASFMMALILVGSIATIRLKTPPFRDHLHIRDEVKLLVLIFLVWATTFCLPFIYDGITDDWRRHPKRLDFIWIFALFFFCITQAGELRSQTRTTHNRAHSSPLYI